MEHDRISARLSAMAGEGHAALSLEKSREIMEMAGIPFNRSGLALTPDEGAALAGDIGYPLVMKIVSPQVIHKTEVGGVRVGIKSEEELRENWDDMVKKALEKYPGAEIKGVMLEEMVKGTEFIIGTTEDAQFGPMIMFGVGGIFVEVYKDVSFRLVPINRNDAKYMQEDLRGKALLKGVRGLPAADPDVMADILMGVSELVDKHREIKEMDINPLFLTERGPVAVDARIILTDKNAKK